MCVFVDCVWKGELDEQVVCVCVCERARNTCIHRERQRADIETESF